jgi:DNA-binding CsgD family transcriptional regulator
MDPEQLSEREKEIVARLSSGLSDQQIADDLYLSLNTVKWYNRQIYSKLGVSSRTQAIARAQKLGILDSDILRSPLQIAKTNLPTTISPFIGRNREIAEVKQLVRTHHLLTLTGIAGTGKTRLALRVAEEILDEFSDGVWFVDLAPLTDHTLVAKAISRSLGVFEQPGEPLPDTLTRALTQREMLLLIDNFEHVIQAAHWYRDYSLLHRALRFLPRVDNRCAYPGSRNI